MKLAGLACLTLRTDCRALQKGQRDAASVAAVPIATTASPPSANGLVMLLGDPGAAKVTVNAVGSQRESARGAAAVGSGVAGGGSRAAGRALQYHLPRVYADLLGRFQGELDVADHVVQTEGGSGGGQASTGENVGERSGPGARSREFWRDARRAARERLGALALEAEPWEQRVAELRESIWIEELGVGKELRRFRLTVETIPRAHARTRSDGLFVLDIGDLGDTAVGLLEEKRLLRGVRILVRCSQGNTFTTSPQPGGAGAGILLLAAPPSLEDAHGPFEVEFHPHRFQQVAMHRALASPMVEGLVRADLGETVDRAAVADSVSCDALEALPASLNEGQRRAVATALSAAASGRGLRYGPLVVWGPPGTGKTTLAAFIIWHLVQRMPADTRILAAAPSNTGADVLCSKLAKLGLGEDSMLRLNALGRSVGTVPEELRKYCARAPEGSSNSFAVPPLKELRRFKVVVATCISSAHLANTLRAEGLPHGWFSHVVVDEAGEATEPETLVPLSLLRPTAGAAVLLGDHFQLGPLVLSSLSRELSSLHAPMIERVAAARLTAADGGSKEDASGMCRDMLEACEARGLHFLTESYRSHEAIMSLYSRLFYGDQLEHRARPQHLRLLPFFEALGLRVPVILHHTVGAERRDPGSASLYNLEETRIVRGYLEDVLNHDLPEGLVGSDVGVITPYTRQLRMMEQHINDGGARLAGVECGTVEKFQGQERRVIIISTVRSSRSATASQEAARRPIGFLADPKRLNVAISRAVAGLIIVGDLRLLAAHSASWRALLQMGKEMGALRGEPLDEEPVLLAARGLRTEPQPRQVPASEARAAWDALTDSSA